MKSPLCCVDRQVQPRRKESLLTCLADLFNSIATQKKKVGVIPPKKFISRLRKENGGCSYDAVCVRMERERCSPFLRGLKLSSIKRMQQELPVLY